MADDKLSSAEKGGHARAERLSPEERRLIAVAAAEKRWGKRLPVAEYDGVLKIPNGDGSYLEFPCAVLSDRKTRVLTEMQFMKTMGIYRSGALSVRRQREAEGGAHLPLSLAFKNLKPFVDKHLGDVHIRPLVFRTTTGNVAHGIPAEIIPKICEVWIDADRAGVLGKTQKAIAAQADILLRGLAQVGIIAMVDEVTGFQKDRERDALAKILEAFVAKALQKWVRRFPFEYYENLFALKGWDRSNLTPNSPKRLEVGRITDDLIYKRLAPGVRAELKRLTPRNEKGYLANKLHQRLTDDIGNPRLEKHIAVVVALMQISDSWDTFMGHMNRVLPAPDKNYELALDDLRKGIGKDG